MPPPLDHHADAPNPHDPGSDAAGERALAVEAAARQTLITRRGTSIRIGTASWTDPTMTAPGVFYPRGADSAEERLSYYAATFPIVEVDATYYAIPSARVAAAWVDRTPPDFVFDAKAHALMTGQPTEVKRLPKELRSALPADLAAKARVYARDLPGEIVDEVWRLYLAGLEPLRASGQLGSVLLQFPRWFFPTSESRDAILDARARLDDVRSAVEFRSETWFNEKNRDRTLRFLNDNSIPLVMVDGPQGLRGSVPPLSEVTSPELAVVRFHGRRVETWEATGIPVVERFRYLYSEEELRDWSLRIREAAEKTREMHVLMNNCYANYGSTNARELAAMLGDDLAAEPDGKTAEPDGPHGTDLSAKGSAPPVDTQTARGGGPEPFAKERAVTRARGEIGEIVGRDAGAVQPGPSPVPPRDPTRFVRPRGGVTAGATKAPPGPRKSKAQ